MATKPRKMSQAWHLGHTVLQRAGIRRNCPCNRSLLLTLQSWCQRACLIEISAVWDSPCIWGMVFPDTSNLYIANTYAFFILVLHQLSSLSNQPHSSPLCRTRWSSVTVFCRSCEDCFSSEMSMQTVCSVEGCPMLLAMGIESSQKGHLLPQQPHVRQQIEEQTTASEEEKKKLHEEPAFPASR